MNLLEAVPWAKVASHLHEQVEGLSGPQGALVGAGLGAATAIAAMAVTNRKIHVPTLLAGVAVGVAYGAADKKLLPDVRPFP